MDEFKDYKPNSYKSKEEPTVPISPLKVEVAEKKIEKIITGTATVKKKSELKKFAESFVNEDLANMKTYIISDVLIPTLKKAITDIVVNGIYMIIYPGGGGRYKSDYPSSKISYDKPSYMRSPEQSPPKVKTGFSYDDVLVDTLAEAKDIVVKMDEIMAYYKMVSVADLYDLAGVSCPHTYNNYGWTDIRSAEPVRVWDGRWAIKLPRPLPFN